MLKICQKSVTICPIFELIFLVLNEYFTSLKYSVFSHYLFHSISLTPNSSYQEKYCHYLHGGIWGYYFCSNNIDFCGICLKCQTTDALDTIRLCILNAFQQKHLCNYLIFSDIAKIIEKVSIFYRGISCRIC